MTLKNVSYELKKKIEEQCSDIIDKIKDRQELSKNLQQIQVWIEQQINNKFSSNNAPFIAVIIDSIYQCFEMQDKEKRSLVEDCLINLIYNCEKLPDHRILALVSYLKAYSKTDDADAQDALKEFIESGKATNFLRDISKKLMSTCEDSLSNFSSHFKPKLSTPSAVELGKEAGLSNQTPFFKDVFPKQKKKLKPRIIEFDEEGKGYEFFNWYRCFLDKINLEIDPEEVLNEELERLGRIELNQESYLNKLKRKFKIYEFDLFASEEEKDARQRNIEQKIENDKKHKKRQKISKLLIPKILGIQEKIEIYKKAFDSKSLSIESSLFETSNDEFLIAFLKTINYEKFKELIIFSEYILNCIDNMRETFKKIDNFFKDLGIASNYISILDSYYRQNKENFNRQGIANFLESALILFEQKTLAFDNEYCLLNMQAKKQKEIVFSKLVFLDEFISNNNAQQVFKLLSDDISTFFQVNLDSALIRNSYLEKNTNMLKKLLNYFTGNYYFCNQSHKDKFVKIFLLNFQEEFTFEFIRNKITKLKWWNFIFSGISPARVFEKGFNERLSEKLYLKLLEEKFKKITEKPVPNVENIDKLYAIKNDINSFKNKILDHSINLNSLNVLDSRQSIVNQLKKNEEIKQLLDNVLILSDQASSCIKEFNELKYVCSREIEKVSQNNQIFQLNTNDVSKLHFPLKWR